MYMYVHTYRLIEKSLPIPCEYLIYGERERERERWEGDPPRVTSPSSLIHPSSPPLPPSSPIPQHLSIRLDSPVSSDSEPCVCVCVCVCIYLVVVYAGPELDSCGPVSVSTLIQFFLQFVVCSHYSLQ